MTALPLAATDPRLIAEGSVTTPAGFRAGAVQAGIKPSGKLDLGLLVSDRTRIPGLISVFDIAPTIRALANGKSPPITARTDAHPVQTLNRLDRHLNRSHDARDPAMLLMISLLVVYGLAGLFLCSRLLARASDRQAALQGLPRQ